MLLFFDTETTGFANGKKPLDDPSQPEVVQLAAILCSHDGGEVSSINMLIDPGEIEINPHAAKVHGITDEIAKMHGVSPIFALSAFSGLSKKATKFIAHNTPFDKLIMEVSYARNTKSSPCPIGLNGSDICDTMEMACPIVKCPPTAKMKACGMNKFKNPRLDEAYMHFFNKELDGAHDALVDVRACKEIYFELIKGDQKCLI